MYAVDTFLLWQECNTLLVMVSKNCKMSTCSVLTWIIQKC